METEVLVRDDIFFDEKQIEQCINYIEKWYFKLEPFQKFIIAFIFIVHLANENKTVFTSTSAS
nr:hypothetical protein [Peribacillus butanolivorans]